MKEENPNAMQRYAILGFPLEHSISPQMHNRAFGDYGMKAMYTKIEIHPADFDSTIPRLKKESWQGFNVTIPFKERILPFLDQIDSTAQAIGAVNTIKVKNGQWLGFNTDWQGFLRPIERDIPSLKHCLLLGAGGAARAVAFALIQSNSILSLTVANRTKVRAQKLIEDLRAFKKIDYCAAGIDEIKQNKHVFDLVVNTTSVGMGALKDLSPISLKGLIHARTLVYDLIYNPPATRFLQEAVSLGLRTVNGSAMLVYQAAEAFKIWTGKSFKPETIAALIKEVG